MTRSLHDFTVGAQNVTQPGAHLSSLMVLAITRLAYRLSGVDDNGVDGIAELDHWIDFENDKRGGAEKIIALKNYNASLNHAIASHSLSADDLQHAQLLTSHLTPYVQQLYAKHLVLKATPWDGTLVGKLKALRPDEIVPVDFSGNPNDFSRNRGRHYTVIAPDPFDASQTLIIADICLTGHNAFVTSLPLARAELLPRHSVQQPVKPSPTPYFAVIDGMSNVGHIPDLETAFIAKLAAFCKENFGVQVCSTFVPLKGLPEWIANGQGFDQLVLDDVCNQFNNFPRIDISEFRQAIATNEIPKALLPVYSRVALHYATSGEYTAQDFKYLDAGVGQQLRRGGELARLVIDDNNNCTLTFNFNADHVYANAIKNNAGNAVLGREIRDAFGPSYRIATVEGDGYIWGIIYPKAKPTPYTPS
jgi:hypothetical protein